jgi:hypothetical protein
MKTVILLLLITCAPLFARIGATPEECDSRYGEPDEVRLTGGKRSYSIGALRINCWFKEGKCDAVNYSLQNVAITSGGILSAFSENQVQRILAINARDWEQVKKDERNGGMNGIWRDKNISMFAKVFRFSVTIESGQHVKEALDSIEEKAVDKVIDQISNPVN